MIKIICENGVNFKNLEEAKMMIDKAKEIGAFLSKFQVYDSGQVKDHPQRAFLESIRLSYWDIKELFEHGRSIGQEVFFTPMFELAVDWCEQVGVHYYKIRFLDRNNLDLEMKIKNTGKLFFKSVDGMYAMWKNEKHLYCVPRYPSSMNDYPFSVRNGYNVRYDGISNHVGLDLLKYHLKFNPRYEYHEIHVKLDGTKPLEDAWSVSFSDLKKVLEGE